MEYKFKENYDDYLFEDFNKEYYKLIEFRKEYKIKNESSLYSELHHIKPRFMNGGDEEENLVRLTAREHFMVHYFLMKYLEKKVYSSKFDKAFRSFTFILEKVKVNDSDNILVCSELYEKERYLYLNYLEERGKERVRELCGWIFLNKRIPKDKAKTKEERKLGSLLKNLKNGKHFKDSNKLFFDSYIDIAKLYRCNNLFEYIDYEKETLYNISMICEFKINNNKLPSKLSKDNYERKLGQLLGNLKHAINKGGNTKIYDSYYRMIESYGYNDLFIIEEKNKRKNKTITIEEMFKWIKVNGTPNIISNGMEKSVYNKMDGLKRKRRKLNWDNKLDERSKSIGYEYLFYSKDDLRYLKVKDICDFIDKNNRIPSTIIYESEEEKLLSYTLYSLKKEYKNNKLKHIYIDRSKELGYPDLYKPLKINK